MSNDTRLIKNLLVICVGFLLLFCAFQSLANLQSTINSEEGLGVLSQSIIYAAVIASSLFLPKFIIRKLGCKWTIALSIATYCPYIAANFQPEMWTFAPTAVLLGLGCAPLWCAKCTYLNLISAQYASGHDGETVDAVISRFFGIFFMVFQSTQIWGNLISYYVLRPNNKTVEMKTISSCGMVFCPDTNVTDTNLSLPDERQRTTLIGIYLACAVAAVLVVSCLLDPLYRKEKAAKDENSLCNTLPSTFRHMTKVSQLFLIPITIYSGIEQAFFLGDFTQAYIGCSWGVYHVGYVFIFYGIVNALMSFCAGRLLKYVRRLWILLAATAGNLAASLLIFLWSPSPDEAVVFFVIAGIWGFCDAIWQSQINALYGSLFIGAEEEAFSNYRLWESFGFSLSFAYSKFLCLRAKMFLLLAFLVVGVAGLVAVERRGKHSLKCQRSSS